MRTASTRDMPTAAKLAGALVFGGCGALAALLGIPTLPDEVVPGYLLPLSGVTGLWLGWALMGRSPGRNIAQAITNGAATVIAMVLFVLVSISCWEMIERSMRLRYDGPGEAVLDVANLLVYYAGFLAVPGVIAVLAIGASLGSVVVLAVSRIWK